MAAPRRPRRVSLRTLAGRGPWHARPASPGEDPAWTLYPFELRLIYRALPLDLAVLSAGLGVSVDHPKIRHALRLLSREGLIAYDRGTKSYLPTPPSSTRPLERGGPFLALRS